MKKLLFVLFLVLHLACKPETVSHAQAATFQLASPIIELDSILFSKSAQVTMDLGLPKSTINYTLDGGEVDQNSAEYNRPITIENSATIKAKSFHDDYLSSTTATAQTTQITHTITNANIQLTPEPHENYQGNGAMGLIDLQKGSLHFRGSKEWLGFQTKEVNISMVLKSEHKISALFLSHLVDQSGWIFPPKSVQVLSNGKEIGRADLDQAANKQTSHLGMTHIPINIDNYTNIELRIIPLDEIPSWHDGKGTSPWLFIDEILIE